MTTPQPRPWDLEKEAKKLVGKWGYEEPYWWKPIVAFGRRCQSEAYENAARRVDELGQPKAQRRSTAQLLDYIKRGIIYLKVDNKVFDKKKKGMS